MSAPRLARATYRALLRLHPSARDGYGPQMAATFEALLLDAQARGLAAIVGLTWRESVGLLGTAWAGRRPAGRRPVGSDVWQDVRYALRTARRRPLFAGAVIATLGLGIGANTGIYSLMSALLLQRLPFPEPDRLVMVWEDASRFGFPRNTPSPGSYNDWAHTIPAFAAVAALAEADFNLTGDGEPEKIGGAEVTANAFDLLGVPPLIGRTWRPDEAGQHVAVLSYALWQRRFAGDAAVLARPVMFNQVPYTIVGVMPPRFQITDPDLQVYTPLILDAKDLANRGDHYLEVVARLAPGTTVAEANVELGTLAVRLQHDDPNDNVGIGMYAVPLLDDYLGSTRAILVMLLAAVGVVLLIACANVANLLLARAAGRRRETATRAALGAGRGRLVRQLLTESLVLAFAGGLVGLVLADWSFGTLRHLVPPSLVELSRVGLDGRVLLGAGAVTGLTAVLFGLVPALRASRVDMATGGGLSAARGVIGGPSRLAYGLVIAEIALATVLLISAGLITESFRQASQLDLGFRPDHVLTLRLQLPHRAAADPAHRQQFVDAVLDRVRAIPGVTTAGYTSAVPFVWKGGTSGFYPEGQPATPALAEDAVNRVITPGYMETLGMTLRAGRWFDGRDTTSSEPVAIINELMARTFWPGGQALGGRFRSGAEGGRPQAPLRTIVGIVGDTYPLGLDAPRHAEMYFPLTQSAANWMWPRDLAVRATGDPATLLPAIRAAVHAVDPTQPISNVALLADLVSDELQGRRLQTRLMLAFGGLALTLAAIGIYSLLSYAVTSRTAEIGVRLALGGDPARIRRHVVAQGLALSGIGLTLGLLIAFWAAGYLSPLLFHVPARDPSTFVAQAAALACVCLAAVYVPARRASRVDPLAALRAE